MIPSDAAEIPHLLSDDADARKIEVALLKRLVAIGKDFNGEPSVLLELLESGRMAEELPPLEDEEAAPVRRNFSEATARSNNAQLRMSERINRIVEGLRALDARVSEDTLLDAILDRLEQVADELRAKLGQQRRRDEAVPD